MTRSILAAAFCTTLTWGATLPAVDDNPIRKKLDDAKAAYDKAIRNYKEEVGEWFMKEDGTARKLKSGVTEKVKQVAAERKEFEDKGVLPKRAPVVLRDRPIKATDSLVKAYKTASDEFSRQKMDDEAATVEKELDNFKKGGSVVTAAPADPFRVKSVWVGETPRMALTVTERVGEKFKAKFEIGDKIEREVRGTIKDGKLSWLAKNVTVVRGGVGGDNDGTLGRDKIGDKIDFVWRGEKGANGMFTLRLSNGK